ncbi:MAG: histidine kinase [Verrucomicrobia bacterium]|nr:histidine kinase [Verrucomicrobiota bacterium]
MEEVILSKVCVLVTAAFLLTLVPGFRRPNRSLLSVRDRGTALLVFLLLGFLEEAVVRETGWFNQRIVAVCAAGLVAGPVVGLIVGTVVTWLAVVYDGLPLATIGVSMLAGGLAGGLLQRWRPKIAQSPWAGFLLTLAVSWFRDGLLLLFAPSTVLAAHAWHQLGVAPFIQGLGTALILAIVGQARQRDDQARAAASAEVRAMQARMNPHFLFNALNALAGLATVAPREVPRAVGRLRKFLRASFDQPEQALVPLEEELGVVRAYLDIESLRLGNRLKQQTTIQPGLSDALLPPFSLQPIVENAVQHGLHSTPQAGRLSIVIGAVQQFLEVSVSDDGRGVPSADVEKIFFGNRTEVHAMALLRRRLQGLYHNSFRLEVRSELEHGTTVTMRIPLRRGSGISRKSGDDPVCDFYHLAPR